MAQERIRFDETDRKSLQDASDLLLKLAEEERDQDDTTRLMFLSGRLSGLANRSPAKEMS